MAEASIITEPRPIEVFCAYSHKDEPLRDELETHLSALKRSAAISVWHDRRISPGKEWDDEIDEHLNQADLILLLVSADFIASDYCYDKEVTRAMERHQLREARVIPVILRDCDWGFTKFSKLQALPKDGKAVAAWTSRDEALKGVAVGIRKVVEELARKPIKSRSEPSGFMSGPPETAAPRSKYFSPIRNPRDLLLYGPRIKVMFGPPILRNPAGTASAIPNSRVSGKFLMTDALLDLGAGRTVLTPDAVQRAALPKIDQTTIITVGGSSKVDVYAASLQFPNSNLSPIEMITVLCCELTYPLFRCLLGRDVLSRWTLTYDGPVGTWQLTEEGGSRSVDPPEGFNPNFWTR